MLSLLRHHPRETGVGILLSLSAFVVFYVITVFALTWGTTEMGYSRNQFLVMQLIGVLFFGLGIPLSARVAEAGRRPTAIGVNLAIVLFGLVLGAWFEAGPGGVLALTIVGMGLVGLVYGPLGTMLSEQFPTEVRYSGTSLAFNLAGIFGASLAPYAATWLARHYGLESVGWYVSLSGLLALLGVALTLETKDRVL
jgi:MFS family permease